MITTGRFSTGAERVPDSPAERHVGRFSSGIEQFTSQGRIASFADGARRDAHGIAAGRGT